MERTNRRINSEFGKELNISKSEFGIFSIIVLIRIIIKLELSKIGMIKTERRIF